MKKIISLILSVLMAISAFVLPVSANAAQPNMLSMSVSGTLIDSIVDDTINNVNAYRNSYEYGSVQIDTELMNQARIRATEIIFRGLDYNENVEELPDGKNIYTRFSDWGSGTFTKLGTLSEATVSNLELYIGGIMKYSDYKEVKSVGVACFVYKNTTFFYAISSKKPAKSIYNDFTNKPYSRTVNVLTKNIDYGSIEATKVNDAGKYNLSFKANFKGEGYVGYLQIPNNQIKFVSSNPKALKIVDTRAYSKKDGKVNVSVYDNYNNYIYFEAFNVTFSTTAPSWSYGSPKGKKKKIVCEWYGFSNASGYQIQYSTNKNFKKAKTKTIKGANKTKATLKKLKSKKRYYIRVRAFRNQGDGEKAYTSWSKKAKVKVK